LKILDLSDNNIAFTDEDYDFFKELLKYNLRSLKVFDFRRNPLEE